MNLKQITVGVDSIWVRPLTYREHRELLACEEKTEYLITHIVVDEAGRPLDTEALNNLGMDIIYQALDYYTSLGRKEKN